MKRIAVSSLVSLLFLSCSVPLANNSTQKNFSSLSWRMQYAPTDHSSPVRDNSSPSHQTHLLGVAGVGSLHPSLLKDNFSDLEKEYKSFSTKALSDAYVKRMFGKYLGGTLNSVQLTRQLEFARYLKNNSDTSYESSLIDYFAETPSLYETLIGNSDIQSKISNEPATFGAFVQELSPFVSIPEGLFADNITASGFIAHWDTISGVTYEIVVDSNQPVSTGVTNSYTVTGLTGINHSFKVRIIRGTLTGNYSSVINVPLFPTNVILVKANAIGSIHDGTSWTNAYTSLQTALSAAVSGKEIWVAAGTYKPGTTRINTFQLKSGVAIYGGFAGNETALSQRNFNTNISILSGDIDNTGTTSGGDSYHVVTGITGATLDGVTVKHGYTSSTSNGGGMINNSASPTINNVIFSNNYSGNNGGGMSNENHSNPNITNSTFSGNSADYGGAMHNVSSSPIIDNVIFTNNNSQYQGGAINISGYSPKISNSTFSGNSATSGGGIYSSGASTPELTNVIFSGNSASSSGGGMTTYASTTAVLTNVTFSGNSATSGAGVYNLSASPIFKNVLFINNTASSNGGGMYNSSASPTITNSVFYYNSASSGKGIYSNGSSSVPIVRNSIFWGNSIYNNSSYIMLGYSDVQGGFSGINANIRNLSGTAITDNAGYTAAGNINADPLFVSSDTDGGDSKFMTSDDGLVLQSTSPARNTGTNTGASATDILGVNRPQGGTVDMGAYEFVE